MSFTETVDSVTKMLTRIVLIIVLVVGVAYAIMGGSFQPAIDWATPIINKLLDKF